MCVWAAGSRCPLLLRHGPFRHRNVALHHQELLACWVMGQALDTQLRNAWSWRGAASSGRADTVSQRGRHSRAQISPGSLGPPEWKRAWPCLPSPQCLLGEPVLPAANLRLCGSRHPSSQVGGTFPAMTSELHLPPVGRFGLLVPTQQQEGQALPPAGVAPPGAPEPEVLLHYGHSVIHGDPS